MVCRSRYISRDKPFIVEIGHHMKFSVPALRHSKTRVYGYHTVTRPHCRSLISHPLWAACLQRGLLYWPFKPSLVLCVLGCCKSESVSTACIALFQSPAICCPPSPVLCGAMCSALALLVTALEQCLLYTHTHTRAHTHTHTYTAACLCTDLDFHTQTAAR